VLLPVCAFAFLVGKIGNKPFGWLNRQFFKWHLTRLAGARGTSVALPKIVMLFICLTCYGIALQWVMIKKKKCNNKECGKYFYGTKRAKFCSDKCRVTNWRKSCAKSMADKKSNG
jgi:hypothetical protein